MKYLVTGGLGFIGSYLVDLLLSENHSVTVIDNLSSESSSRNYIREGVRYWIDDIRNINNAKYGYDDTVGSAWGGTSATDNMAAQTGSKGSNTNLWMWIK